MLLLGLGGVGFSDLYVLGGRLSRRVLGKSGFSFWAGTLFYVGILSAHVSVEESPQNLPQGRSDYWEYF